MRLKFLSSTSLGITLPYLRLLSSTDEGALLRKSHGSHHHTNRQICYILNMLVPFSHLVLNYREIGLHRSRHWGLGQVFGFRSLYGLPFLTLGGKVRRAYMGDAVPSHEGWTSQREALRWLVDRGSDGVYALDPGGIQVKYTPNARYYIVDGNHRALALYILGERTIRTRIKR